MLVLKDWKWLHLKFSSSIMAERNSKTLVKIFEYLSDRQFDTADVQQRVIKIKHHTDMHDLSEHCEAKKTK